MSSSEPTVRPLSTEHAPPTTCHTSQVPAISRTHLHKQALESHTACHFHAVEIALDFCRVAWICCSVSIGVVGAPGTPDPTATGSNRHSIHATAANSTSSASHSAYVSTRQPSAAHLR